MDAHGRGHITVHDVKLFLESPAERFRSWKAMLLSEKEDGQTDGEAMGCMWESRLAVRGQDGALLPVDAGKCYRMRFIAAFSNTENLVVAIAGHNMTLVSVDGAYDVAPLAVASFNIHLGERVDVILCADQTPGNYLVNAT